MQKKLSDYFRTLVERRQGGDLLADFYDAGALLRTEEQAQLIVGLLVGLNVVDCNLCVKVRNTSAILTVLLFT